MECATPLKQLFVFLAKADERSVASVAVASTPFAKPTVVQLQGESVTCRVWPRGSGAVAVRHPIDIAIGMVTNRDD
jgi:hypothetical protein